MKELEDFQPDGHLQMASFTKLIMYSPLCIAIIAICVHKMDRQMYVINYYIYCSFTLLFTVAFIHDSLCWSHWWRNFARWLMFFITWNVFHTHDTHTCIALRTQYGGKTITKIYNNKSYSWIFGSCLMSYIKRWNRYLLHLFAVTFKRTQNSQSYSMLNLNTIRTFILKV